VTAPKPSLLRRIGSRVRSELGLPLPWISHALLGRDFVVRAGTLHHKVDYDDAWLYACAKHSEVMFDVGANVGQSTLLALRSPRIKQVVMIEANWEALSVAADNLIRNNLSAKARFIGAFAAEASNASIDFWTVGTGAAGSMFQGHAVTASKAGSVTTVPTITLDDVCDGLQITPDLVKMDIEGAEAKALAGSTRLARKHAARFLVEMHSPPELPMARNAQLILDWSERVGYSAWYLSGGVLLASPDLIAHRGRCHLLLQPSDWPYPEWLVGIKQSAELVP
jgi:FkbM family methyltransferase